MKNDTLMAKELSWISFNERVLQEAQDPTVPIIERVRFLGIYSSNQDEFFKVKIAELKRQVMIEEESGPNSPAGALLKKALARVKQLGKVFDRTYKELMEELTTHNIYLLDENQISQTQLEWVKNYFRTNVLKHISPVIINENIDLVTFLKDKYPYLFIKMSKKNAPDQYALIEIPTDILPRFIQIPSDNRRDKVLMILDNVIRIGLNRIFCGLFDYDEICAYTVKMNRDAEYDLSAQLDRTLLENMSHSLKQRLIAMPVRVAYDREMPKAMVEQFIKQLHIKDMDSVMDGGRYHNFKDFISFPNVGREYLEHTRLPALNSSRFDNAINMFSAIAAGDILLYYPYHSFRYFTELLRQASYDPAVRSIKINIYRVASNSRVINSLIDAANNGKNVTVVVELKARFDEENNIRWASRLTEAGVKVLFGMPSLKIHSKLCLISRIEDNAIVRYAHIGTGNFNEKTAKIYTDFALFTKNADLTEEVEKVFDFIEYPYTRPKFNHLMVSPINARKKIYELIDNEIKNVKAGLEARIILKVNNLVDKSLIEKLYEASAAGVRIDIIVRGMCSLLPGVPGLSDNIKGISIVDRFLEHPRIMYFHSNGDFRLYISSADWMTRNLDLRIEVGTPIYDPELKKHILNILNIQLSDNMKARIINREQDNKYVPRGNRKKVRSQIAIYDYVESQENAMAKTAVPDDCCEKGNNR
ncbi:polyphosphate kinase 1 [uncultured Ruminobacter sp.]|uniref:polyphosphate kinase 1 n=1 Tax=uncultured Ruminobacter sp. TaxID=538947 RepID=UPI0025D65039|nr:polyphosphate kinase 1 [uncultured Ruminobacter sp.]